MTPPETPPPPRTPSALIVLIKWILSFLYFAVSAGVVLGTIYVPVSFFLLNEHMNISMKVDPAGKLKGAGIGYGMSHAFGMMAILMYSVIFLAIVWLMTNIPFPPRNKLISWLSLITATILFLALAALIMPRLHHWPHLYAHDNFVLILAGCVLLLTEGPAVYLTAWAARKLARLPFEQGSA